MKKSVVVKVSMFLIGICCLATSCADHDDPELTPINTSEVKITSSVNALPTASWLNPTEEMTIRVSNVSMSAPKGVVLRSISLCEGGRTVLDKPFSGETLEFKVPLTSMRGRVNFSIVGNLIQKNCRDAQILIEDNIQRIVFTQTPKLECKAHINVTVKSVSTSGEEFSQWFDVESNEAGVVLIPQDKLYWAPASGTASVIELTLGGGAYAWSPNSTLESDITRVSWGSNYPNDPVLKLSIANTPGSLDNEKLSMYVLATYFGTNENITVEPQRLTTVFDIRESK
ncbi:MAG: hypothetical protein K2K52_08000 [Paramuribaculum sp.]|nr:hypothetical protein [Paramuribaculum sp.]MDE6460750.1 hypothetical protein [Paramuribaculum sp.]